MLLSGSMPFFMLGNLYYDGDGVYNSHPTQQLIVNTSSRNCLFRNLTFQKHLKICAHDTILQSKSLILEIGSQIKILCKKIILNRAFKM